jgi:hypothetical protein
MNWTERDGIYTTADVGKRHAEVCRREMGAYFFYGTIDGRICKRMPDEPAAESFAAAKARAERFLRNEITPETWK